jgi:hypothetical protein
MVKKEIYVQSDEEPHTIKPIVVVSCDTCEKELLCLRTFDTSICIDCWELESHTQDLWTDICEICGNLYEECTGCFCCEECKKMTGPCCAALYYCQSSWGTCKKCFDYKCSECDDTINMDQQYVGDVDVQDSCYPICDSCRENA